MLCDKLAAEQEQQVNNNQSNDSSGKKFRKTEARVDYQKRLAIEQEQNQVELIVLQQISKPELAQIPQIS